MSKIAESVVASGNLVSSRQTTKENPEMSRAHAVGAALEVIAIYVSGNGGGNNGQLESEMKKLSMYADLIQAATKI